MADCVHVYGMHVSDNNNVCVCCNKRTHTAKSSVAVIKQIIITLTAFEIIVVAVLRCMHNNVLQSDTLILTK